MLFRIRLVIQPKTFQNVQFKRNNTARKRGDQNKREKKTLSWLAFENGQMHLPLFPIQTPLPVTSRIDHGHRNRYERLKLISGYPNAEFKKQQPQLP